LNFKIENNFLTTDLLADAIWLAYGMVVAKVQRDGQMEYNNLSGATSSLPPQLMLAAQQYLKCDMLTVWAACLSEIGVACINGTINVSVLNLNPFGNLTSPGLNYNLFPKTGLLPNVNGNILKGCTTVFVNTPAFPFLAIDQLIINANDTPQYVVGPNLNTGVGTNGFDTFLYSGNIVLQTNAAYIGTISGNTFSGICRNFLFWNSYASGIGLFINGYYKSVVSDFGNQLVRVSRSGWGAESLFTVTARVAANDNDCVSITATPIQSSFQTPTNASAYGQVGVHYAYESVALYSSSPLSEAEIAHVMMISPYVVYRINGDPFLGLSFFAMIYDTIITGGERVSLGIEAVQPNGQIQIDTVKGESRNHSKGYEIVGTVEVEKDPLVEAHDLVVMDCWRKAFQKYVSRIGAAIDIPNMLKISVNTCAKFQEVAVMNPNHTTTIHKVCEMIKSVDELSRSALHYNDSISASFGVKNLPEKDIQKQFKSNLAVMRKSAPRLIYDQVSSNSKKHKK